MSLPKIYYVHLTPTYDLPKKLRLFAGAGAKPNAFAPSSFAYGSRVYACSFSVTASCSSTHFCKDNATACPENFRCSLPVRIIV